MINWILLAARSPAPSSSQSAAPSPFLSHFPSPSPPAGPLASRRGDRIISEAFARFLPPSASSSSFLRGEESLIIVTGHGASSFTYSVALSPLSLAPFLFLPSSVFSSRFLSLSPALVSPLPSRTVFPSALPTLQYTLSICLLRSEKMKKGGVAWEIKGCRRRCLHHPTPTSGGERREGSEKEATRRGAHKQSNTPYTCTCIRTPHHTTPWNIAHRALAVWYARHTLSSPRGASYQGPRANHANALRYSAETAAKPATTRNIRPIPPSRFVASDISLRVERRIKPRTKVAQR